MKLQDLCEAPLPDDWDKKKFGPGGTFKDRIAYAKKMAEKVGGGSSRVAFLIPYQGRNTVLKIAKNGKGMAQNEKEVMSFNDAHMLGAEGTVTVPMIDHDEENTQPSWIHVEYAPKLKSEKQFEQLSGFKMEDLLNYVAKLTGNHSLPMAKNKEFSQEFADRIWENEDSFAYEFVNFIGNTDTHLGDLQRVSNWGVYNNNPVIIDLGVDEQILKKFYS